MDQQVVGFQKEEETHLLDEGQTRLTSKGIPIRLIRIVDAKSDIAWVWLVEDLTTGDRWRVLEDDIGQELNEMEVIAWASQ